ncbi:hypothetical protein FB567DRAFT_607288 [Paraphoma chrysanthemicola]|uniref:Uncharacterized protein n=1 Tax=Paraphoma chrysanthemicola TaxID=798071 RepID=A0A8K0VW76_9PLEO|nr:hypothetical protein FB567DRAFT_607288 [Paraphoma chrysanthemicola]
MSASSDSGVLLRVVEPKQGATPDSRRAPPTSPCPNVEQIYTAVADDGQKPSQIAVYVLSHIRPLMTSKKLYDDDIAANPDLDISWVVCGFINGRDKGSPTTDTPSTIHSLSHKPVPGSKLVIVGSTPRPEKEVDYHEWYNVEHGPGLAIVPGWNAARRYALRNSYGKMETASFYGFNYYDEESGLGGPIWEKSTKTEWTFRIRGNAAKPNIRRVWKVQEVL